MKKLTQLQYEAIYLYSKGLTFNEIDTTLTTASKGIYSQVVAKDKGRVTRAKISREINLNRYKIELNNYLDNVKQTNHYYKNSIPYLKEKYTLPVSIAKDYFRKVYINNSLNKAYKSYCKYKLTFINNHLQKVA
jgi:hypothetical protein